MTKAEMATRNGLIWCCISEGRTGVETAKIFDLTAQRVFEIFNVMERKICRAVLNTRRCAICFHGSSWHGLVTTPTGHTEFGTPTYRQTFVCKVADCPCEDHRPANSLEELAFPDLTHQEQSFFMKTSS